MKRFISVTLVVIVIVTAILLFTFHAVRAQGCGLTPLKPLPPLGCQDLVPECRCDRNGRNCHWEWVCVR
jgi:hypothetical protein